MHSKCLINVIIVPDESITQSLDTVHTKLTGI